MDSIDDILAPYGPQPAAEAPPVEAGPKPDTIDSILAPYAPPEAPKPEAEGGTTPESQGFWSTVGDATKKGLIQGIVQTAQFGEAAGRAASGGKFFQTPETPPETQDEIDKLLQAPFSENWYSPKWYGAQIAHGVTSSAPSVALALGGAAAGGATPIPGGALVGGALGFGAGSAIQSILPNFQAAKAQGLGDDEAIDQAIKATGVGSLFATAMGLAPGFSVWGTTAEGLLRAPIKEALLQMGLIQPVIGTTGMVAEHGVTGRDVTLDDIAGSYVTNVGVGMAMSSAHAALARVHGAAEPLPKLAPEPLPGVKVEEPLPGQEAPLINERTRDQETKPGPTFYSAVADHIERKGPNSASGGQWIATLRNAPGIKGEEIDTLALPLYLEGENKQISKKDLLAHIEANQVRIEEIVKSEDPEAPGGETSYEEYTVPGPRQGYHEALIKVNTPEEATLTAARNQVLDFERQNFPIGSAPDYQLDPSKGNEYAKLLTELDAAVKARNENPGPRYISSHWKEPNVIVHFRWTDRIDRDGKRTFFVEEIQADGHQEGRRSGYRSDYEASLNRLVDAEKKAIVTSQRLKTSGVSADKLIEHPEYIEAARRYIDEDKRHNDLFAGKNVVPDLPFKSSWHDLAIKAILRHAADGGYDRIAWTNGEMQRARYPAEGAHNHGLMEFYDKIITNRFGYWAKKMGMGGGETKLRDDTLNVKQYPRTEARPVFGIFDPETGNIHGQWGTREHAQAELEHQVRQYGLSNGEAPIRYIDVPPAAASRIRMGLPLFKEMLGAKLIEPGRLPAEAENLKPAIRVMRDIIAEWKGRLRIDRPLRIEIVPEIRTAHGTSFGTSGVDPRNGDYVIRIATTPHKTAEDVYATMTHEFGHVVKRALFEKAPAEVKQGIIDAYNAWAKESVLRPSTSSPTGLRSATFEELIKARDNAISIHNDHFNMEKDPANAQVPILSLTPERQRYWAGFEEWFAEQVARWATTSEKPLSVVDRFFLSLGTKIREIVTAFRAKFGLDPEPVKAMKEWLDSQMLDGPYAADIVAQMQFETIRINQAAFNGVAPEVQATPITAASVGGRGIIKRLFGAGGTEGGDLAAASADKYNKFYEWMISLPQLARINPHIGPLQLYNEVVSLMHMKKITGMNAALSRLHEWQRLGGQRNPLSQMILDVMERRYLTAEEVAKKVRRAPTESELQDLALKHGVDERGLDMYRKLEGDFKAFLARAAQMWKTEANRIKDPVLAAQKIVDIDAKVNELLKEPYFPFMRFGEYTLTVRDAANSLVGFQRFESKRKRDAALRDYQRNGDKTHQAQGGKLEADTAPLSGMPPMLLEKMASTLKLSKTQQARLEEIRFEYSPQNSFRHRFEKRNRIEGYSTDVMRAYANYFFHGWNHIVRVEHAEQLRAFVKQTRFSGGRAPDVTKRQEISNFMGQHMEYLLDPKDDFHTLKGLAFTWFLGWSPAAATLNLSQTIMGTYPWMASKFGDVAAMKHMLRASGSLSTFYKKSTIQHMTERDARALSEGIKEGRITEALAPNLAANSEGRNLGYGFGGTLAQRMWSGFTESAGKMFELTEQTNRRVAFRAAWSAALENPGVKYLSDLQQRMPLLYNRFLDRGWTPTEARALLAAMDVTDSTQFVYAPYSRPKFMWGRKGTVFVFKSFTQNTLFAMMHNPSAGVRSLLIMGALGGLMGIPGAEDLTGLLRGLAWQLFGKDFDLNDQARQFVVDHLNGAIPPDGLLHGLSRYGYGIPQVLDMLGSLVGASKLPVPMFDRHGALGMGNILPVEPGKLLGPAKNQTGPIADSTQRASGAVFGLAFSLYKALTDQQHDWNDRKRWEQIMPRAIKNTSQAFRYYQEGEERNSRGAAVVRFDPYEPQHMFEILGKAMGYQPTRLQQQYDLRQAEQEAQTYWDLRRQGLLRQGFAAKKNKDDAGWQSVLGAIRAFNEELPTEAKGKAITGAVLRQSFQNRAKQDNATESGVPMQRANQGLARSVQRLFPEVQIDVRKVK